MTVSERFPRRCTAFPQEGVTGTARRLPWTEEGLYPLDTHGLPPLQHLLVIGALSLLLWATLIGGTAALL